MGPIRGARIAALAIVIVLLPAAASAQRATLFETGSSLLYPLFNLWVPAFMRTHPGVRISTQSSGSGTGIADAVTGLAEIGASDAYLSDALARKYPGMLNIPLAISSQIVTYNLPGLNGGHLKLSGTVLAGIYAGRVRAWDDAAIARLNPGVALPHHAIVTLHRTDSSGDTFVFTQYLSFSTPAWRKALGFGTTISWPALPDAIGATGNQGMLSALTGTRYAIAYIGASFAGAIRRDGLGEAALRNRAGAFVLPGAQGVRAAADAMVTETPADGRVSLVFAPGAGAYPIVNYEYAIVRRVQRNAATAEALRALLAWAVSPDGGNAGHFMRAVNFVALPPAVAKLSAAMVADITTNSVIPAKAGTHAPVGTMGLRLRGDDEQK